MTGGNRSSGAAVYRPLRQTEGEEIEMMNRIGTVVSGFTCSLVVLAGFYSFGFVGDLVMPFSVEPGQWPSIHAFENRCALHPTVAVAERG